MSDNPVFNQIQKEIDDNPVVLFMKGSPMFPQCGFSAACVQILTDLEVKFKGIDVLADCKAQVVAQLGRGRAVDALSSADVNTRFRVS